MKKKFFETILDSFHSNKMGHAFLIETNNIENCTLDVINLVKEINCPKKFSGACKDENCNICFQIDNGSMPSIMLIEPIGQNISKEQILEIRNKFIKNSLYIKYNVYIIKNADKLNGVSANSLLKFLEEPECSVIGFFITKNRLNIIPTIRSRCQIGAISYPPSEAEVNNLLEAANNFILALLNSASDSILINREILAPYQKSKEDLTKILDYTMKYLVVNKEKINNSNKLILITTKYIEKTNYNVNILLMLDCYVIEMIKELK